MGRATLVIKEAVTEEPHDQTGHQEYLIDPRIPVFVVY